MATSLSDGEFNRMQTQLLELRETNYELEDRCKKQEREFIALHEQFSILEKDYQKANQALNRSKKAKEFELLIHENESMQMKLQSQEEDFRLQNEALMNELGKLVSINETLEKEVSDAKSAGHSKGIDETANANLLDDIRRLQAHNAALQNSLSSIQKQHEEQIVVLRQTISDVKEQQSNKQPSVQNDVDSTRDVDEADASTTDDTDTAAENGNNDNTAVVADNVAEAVITSDSLKQINEFRLNLETEKEENRLLKEQLQAVEAKNRDDKKTLQSELERLNEKLKKKQESLLQLQEDKERQFCELSEKIQDIQTNKDNEITALRQQVTKFQQELTIERQGHESEMERSKTHVVGLEDQLKELREKIDSTSQANNSKLAEQLDHYDSQINHLKDQICEKSNKIDDLNTQLQECQKSQSSTMDQLLAVQLDRDSQILSLQEANRLAEKRKSLLDQLAVKYQEDTDQHRDQIKTLTASHDSKVIELTEEINRLKVAVVELDDVKRQMDQLKPQISSLEGAKSWLERRLTEVEETLNQTKDQHIGQVHLMKEEHESEINRISECNASQLQDLQSENLRVQAEKDGLNETIKRLNQEIKDQVDDKVLHEKKGTTMLKDLKRQLQAERKRADKLQEKLQEFLSDSRSRQSVEELFHLADSGERPKFGDGSSVSSWSPSGLGRENSILTQSPDEEVSYTSLRQENDELLKRLAGLQEQKWVLEEKVSHLESSNAAMVDDLLRKTAIIEHYSMDNRAGQAVTSPSNEKLTPLKRVVDFVIDKGDDGVKDMNRKLQRVLEETLTKNMHLQQNLEMMSKELEDMRKQTAV